MSSNNRHSRLGSASPLLALLTAMALLVGACGGGGDENGGGSSGGTTDGEDVGDPQPGGELVVGLESETNNYTPGLFSGTQAGQNVARAVYDPLMIATEEGTIEPYLAESLEANADFTEYTLKLREGVTFHDGTPLNADSVIHNYGVLTSEESNQAGNLRNVASLEKVDDLTVKYVMSEPDVAIPDILQGSAGWAFSPTAYDDDPEGFGDNPVGTGPFKVVSWTRDSAFELEKNEDYWQDGLPYLDRITFRPILDEDSRAADISSGGIDATHSVRLSNFLNVMNETPGVKVYMGTGNSGSGAIFNTAMAPVDDVRIRRSLSYALDQGALNEVIAGAAAADTEIRNQYFSESSPFYSQAVADEWPTNDPDEAQTLYDEYINDPSRSDGKAVGEPVELEFNCTNIPSLQEQAQVYQSMWAEIGYETTLNPVEQSVHITNAITDQYMISCWRMGGDEDPALVLGNAFGEPSTTVLNFTNFHTPEIAEILATLRANEDEAIRKEALEEFGMILAEQVPNTWTGSNNEFIAATDDVHGIDSWKLPDGTMGNGAHTGITIWGQVWQEQ